MDEDKPLTHKEFSRRGGKTRAEKLDSLERSKIAKKGGETTKARLGPEHYREIQKLSVESRKRNGGKLNKVEEKFIENAAKEFFKPSLLDRILRKKQP